MNIRLNIDESYRQDVVVDQDGIVCETLDGEVRIHKLGVKPDRLIKFSPQDGTERQIGLVAGRIVEIKGSSVWPGLPQTARLLRAGEVVDAWRLAIFEDCGELFVEAIPSGEDEDEVVCACKGTTRGSLQAFAADHLSRADIGRACGAGTVCGGCGPLIDEIAGQDSLLAGTLVGVERLDHDVARFRFRYLSEVSATGTAGSHVLLQALVDGRWITRPYTVVYLSDGCVDFIVKREPFGLFSRWLHDHAGPHGVFRLSLPQTRPGLTHGGSTVVIAAGVGITPAFLRASPGRPETLRVHWSVRRATSAGLVETVHRALCAAGHEIAIHDTGVEGRASGWGGLYPPGIADGIVVCGGPSFQDAVVSDLQAAGWSRDRIVVESFGKARPEPARLRHVDSFDYLQDPVVADSFDLAPARSVRDEAHAFLRQFYFEHGAPAAFDARWAAVSASIEANGTYTHTYEELAFGARLAWRNSARCIGRFFWKSLRVRDFRHLRSAAEMFDAIVRHLEIATGEGDITPVVTVFPAGEPRIRILNPQLILYAGYRQDDGSVVGDPKNVALTAVATRLGWAGARTRFDVLPVMIQVGDAVPELFDLPRHAVLEVALTHPRCPAFAGLGLRWFAVPAVSGMALDVGGVQFTAAPSNGFYMGTEIGSLNLADPARYDELGRVGSVMGHDTTGADPLWRDQAMLDLNVAVLHSFAKAGVRILDHHAMSDLFVRFREAEARAQRPSYGHWAWVMPPMGGNLSPVWRDNTLQKKILKPNYFYQPDASPDPSSASCPVHCAGRQASAARHDPHTACSRRLDA